MLSIMRVYKKKILEFLSGMFAVNIIVSCPFQYSSNWLIVNFIVWLIFVIVKLCVMSHFLGHMQAYDTPYNYFPMSSR